MKWQKLPSCSDEVLRKIQHIKGLDKVTNGLEIAYYMLLLDVKKQRRRKYGKYASIETLSN